MKINRKKIGAGDSLIKKPIRRCFPIFLLPMVMAFAIGFVYPFVHGLYLSFCKFTTTSNAEWIGFGNYIKAFQDASFRYSFGYTAVFAVVSLVLINVLAFAVAYVLTQKITIKNNVNKKIKAKIYLRSLGAQPDSVEFLSQLGLKVKLSDDNEMGYMFDAAANETAQLTDWVCLGTLYSGGEVNLDVMMARRRMSLNELSERVGITVANLSILKNNKAKAVRFSTLEAICKALDCQPGDILEYRPEE